MTTSFKSLTSIKKHDPVIFFFSKYSFRPTSTKSLKRTVIYSNISLSLSLSLSLWPICLLESSFLLECGFLKSEYFLMLSSVMKNEFYSNISLSLSVYTQAYLFVGK
jgi:hypothetical protein